MQKTTLVIIAFTFMCPFLLVDLFSAEGATLLYFNDGHEIAPVCDKLGTRGGVARIGWLTNSVRREQPNTLLIFGGDLGGGTLFGGVFRGRPMVKAFNKIPVNIAGFGQHDFDFGAKHTKTLVSNSKFAWLTSNLDASNGQSFAGLPRRIIRQLGSVRIGFLALTEAMETTTPGSGLRQINSLDRAQSQIKKLLLKGAEWIIALHQAPLSRNLELLQACPEIDLILTEEQVEDRTTIHWLGNRPIISPCGNMGSLVRIDFPSQRKIAKLKLTVLSVDASVPERRDLARMQEGWMRRLNRRLSKHLTKLPKDISRKGTRSQKSPLAKLVCDAFRSETKAQLALMHGGGLRADLPSGAITTRHAWAVLPFQNDIHLVEFSGTSLMQAIEHGINRYLNKTGALLFISGGTYRFDAKATSGSRLTEFLVNGNTVRPDKRYHVALPSYLHGGGGGFESLTSGKLLPINGQHPKDVDCLIQHLKTLRSSN